MSRGAMEEKQPAHLDLSSSSDLGGVSSPCKRLRSQHAGGSAPLAREVGLLSPPPRPGQDSEVSSLYVRPHFLSFLDGVANEKTER